MKVCMSDPQKLEETGVVAEVFPFEIREFCLVVRKGCVELYGCATMDPGSTKKFAEALVRAAEIAEASTHGKNT